MRRATSLAFVALTLVLVPAPAGAGTTRPPLGLAVTPARVALAGTGKASVRITNPGRRRGRGRRRPGRVLPRPAWATSRRCSSRPPGCDTLAHRPAGAFRPAGRRYDMAHRRVAPAASRRARRPRRADPPHDAAVALGRCGGPDAHRRRGRRPRAGPHRPVARDPRVARPARRTRADARARPGQPRQRDGDDRRRPRAALSSCARAPARRSAPKRASCVPGRTAWCSSATGAGSRAG